MSKEVSWILPYADEKLEEMKSKSCQQGLKCRSLLTFTGVRVEYW